jgi:hypothetical protein
MIKQIKSIFNEASNQLLGPWVDRAKSSRNHLAKTAVYPEQSSKSKSIIF